MDGYEALASAFAQWVDDNGWTQTDVAAMGGPSTSTQTKVRQGHGPFRSGTLRQVDAIMGWKPGTAQRVIRGATPPPGSLEKSGDSSPAESELVYMERRILDLERRLDELAANRDPEPLDRDQGEWHTP